MNTKSPLTKSNNVSLIEIMPSHKIIALWKKQLSIDITKEFNGIDNIYVYQCEETKLKFFEPITVAGKGDLYEKLSQISWYYRPEKWEHEQAIEDLQDFNTILEVGCGRGAFVDRLNRTYHKNALGVELNLDAVKQAQNQGIPVSSTEISQLSDQYPEFYDAVCTFQVLEHVTDIYEFLDSLVKLVKCQGILIIAVPNSDSFLKYDTQGILNQPPHHMSQWNMETFEYLSNLFPVKLKHFKIEPLQKYHIDPYINIMKSRYLNKIAKNNSIVSLCIHVSFKIVKYLLRKSSFLRAHIKGHTLYVCFEKLDAK